MVSQGGFKNGLTTMGLRLRAEEMQQLFDRPVGSVFARWSHRLSITGMLFFCHVPIRFEQRYREGDMQARPLFCLGATIQRARLLRYKTSDGRFRYHDFCSELDAANRQRIEKEKTDTKTQTAAGLSLPALPETPAVSPNTRVGLVVFAVDYRVFVPSTPR